MSMSPKIYPTELGKGANGSGSTPAKVRLELAAHRNFSRVIKRLLTNSSLLFGGTLTVMDAQQTHSVAV